MKAKNIIEIKFSKRGLMRYISHLDLLRAFRRAANRAKFDLEATCGFNPRPKISIVKAIKLGEESDDLICHFGLREKVSPEDFISRFSKELPQGIKISEASLNER